MRVRPAGGARPAASGPTSDGACAGGPGRRLDRRPAPIRSGPARPISARSRLSRAVASRLRAPGFKFAPIFTTLAAEAVKSSKVGRRFASARENKSKQVVGGGESEERQRRGPRSPAGVAEGEEDLSRSRGGFKFGTGFGSSRNWPPLIGGINPSARGS